MAKATHTTTTTFSAKQLNKASQKALEAFNRLIDLYTTTPTGPASTGLLDMARKHVAAFVERESLKEPPFEPEAAHKAWEVEAGRLDDIEIGAMQAMLAYPPSAEGDIDFKFEYVRAHRECTGDNALAYSGAYEALLEALIAGRKNGYLKAAPAETDPRLWIGALVYLDEVDDEDDPTRHGGDHVIEGIDGAGIKVDGSPRWYPIRRVTVVLPDFTMGSDNKRNELDDATLLRLLDRMRAHEKRADELEPEMRRLHGILDQRVPEPGLDIWKRMSEAARKEHRAKQEQVGLEVGYAAAYDLWQAEKYQAFLLQRAIRSMPAHTLAGLKAKAEATTRWHFDGCAVPDQSEGVDARDRSLIMLLGDIAAIEEGRRTRYDGPALPDLSTLSPVDLWMLYKALTSARDLLEPLEEHSDTNSPLGKYVEAWADVLFGAYAEIGKYAMKSGRKELGLLRAQFAIDFAEGQDVYVVGKDVPTYAQPDPATGVAKAA